MSWLMRILLVLVVLVLLVGGVAAGLFINRSGDNAADAAVRILVRQSRKACFRTTADRIVTAKKDAADAMRETLLASLTHGAEARAHRASAAAARDAAISYLSRAGVTDVKLPAAIRTLDENGPGLTGAREAYCAHAFPYPAGS